MSTLPISQGIPGASPSSPAHKRMLKTYPCNSTLMAGWRAAVCRLWLEAHLDTVAELYDSTQSSYVCFAFPHVGANIGCKMHYRTVCFHSWLACLISKIFRQEAIMSGSLENYAQLTMMLNNV